MPPFNDFPCADPLSGNFLSVAERITDIGLDKAYCVFAELIHHHLSSAKLVAGKGVVRGWYRDESTCFPSL